MMYIHLLISLIWAFQLVSGQNSHSNSGMTITWTNNNDLTTSFVITSDTISGTPGDIYYSFAFSDDNKMVINIILYYIAGTKESLWLN